MQAWRVTEGRVYRLVFPPMPAGSGLNSRPATDFPHPYLRDFSQVPSANARVALQIWPQRPVFTSLAASNQFLANSYSLRFGN